MHLLWPIGGLVRAEHSPLIPLTDLHHGTGLPPAISLVEHCIKLLRLPAIPLLSSLPFRPGLTSPTPSLFASLPSFQLSALSSRLPCSPVYSSPSSVLPITLCPHSCCSGPVPPFLSISSRNSNTAPFCLSLQPPLNPSHSAICNSSLLPAHCSHLSLPHISISVPATLSLPCRNSLHLSI